MRSLKKTFREYSRVFMLVFMSLLLVSFLIQDVLSNLARGRGEVNPKIGTAFGRTIYGSEIDRTKKNLEMLSQLRLGPAIRNEDQLINVYLLMEEARRMGVRVGEDEVKDKLREMGVTDAVMAQMQRSSKLTYDQIYDVAGRWLAAERVFDLQTPGMSDSVPRQLVNYRELAQEAVVKVSLIDGHAFLAQLPPPTDEDLMPLFNEFKGQLAGTSDEESFKFGYKFPDRIQVEFLTVDPDRIKDQIDIRDSAAKRHYEENPGKYTRKVPKATSAPADPSKPPETEDVRMTYEEAREQIKAELRMQKAIETGINLVNQMHDEADQPWRNAPLDKDGFHERPHEKMDTFETIRERNAKDYDIQYYLSDVVDEKTIARVPLGFGQAQYIDSATLPINKFAFRVQGLLKPEEGDTLPRFILEEPAPVVFQVQQPGPMDFMNRNPKPRRAYLFKIKQVLPSDEPVVLASVRDKVVEDWKQQRAYEMAKGYAEKIADRARTDGIEMAVASATELHDKLVQADTDAQMVPNSPLENGPPPPPAPDFAKKLEPVEPTTKINRKTQYLSEYRLPLKSLPTTVFALLEEPQTATSPAHRVALLSNHKELKFLIVEVLDTTPVYVGGLNKQLADLADKYENPATTTMERRMLSSAYFDSERIRKRTGYKPAQPPKDAKEE